MNIRKADMHDITNIAELYAINWKKTYSRILPNAFLDEISVESAIKKWIEFFNQPANTIFVSYETNIFYGFAACKKDNKLEDCIYLDSLHVSESSRGKGIGTALIKTVGKFAFDNDYQQMSICIVRGNDYAKHLYEKLGAVHFEYFVDDFNGTKSNSEKLIWNDTKCFE